MTLNGNGKWAFNRGVFTLKYGYDYMMCYTTGSLREYIQSQIQIKAGYICKSIIYFINLL